MRAVRKLTVGELLQGKTSTEYFDEGDYVKAVRADMSKRTTTIEPRIYTIEKCDTGGFRFKKDELRFKLPSVLYGSKIKRISSVISTHYKKAKSSIGAIFVGRKGCGKSQQAELICNQAMDNLKIPTLRVDRAISKNVLLEAIKMLGKCVVYFDEFEKMYKPDTRHSGTLKANEEGTPVDENELLTLFSDKSLEGVLFLITANRKGDLSPYILNRPERFMFCINYEGTDKDVVAEVCEHYKLEEGIAKYVKDYMEDSNSGVDTLISLASCATEFKDIEELKSLFEYLNVPAPKKWGWIIYTQSGESEGLEVTCDRKVIKIVHKDSGAVWELDYDNFYKNAQYNTTYRCYALSGLGGHTTNIKLGLNARGPIPDDEQHQLQYFQLQEPNPTAKG